MAYTQFDDTLPVGTRTGVQMPTDIRLNQQAMRDMIVGDFAVGWNMSVVNGTGTAEEPQYLKWNNNANTNEWTREELTWTSGNVIQGVYSFSSDNEVIYDTIGTITITYDGSGNVTSTTWT